MDYDSGRSEVMHFKILNESQENEGEFKIFLADLIYLQINNINKFPLIKEKKEYGRIIVDILFLISYALK